MPSREKFPCSIVGEMWCCGMPGCDKEILVSKKSGIAYHKNTHFPKYSCDCCNEVFAQKCQLVVHTRIAHTGEKPYCCEHCDRVFPQQSNLLDHMRKNHTTPVEEPAEPARKTFAEMRAAAARRPQAILA
jgi:uncharacterized Zn-finger protein